MLLVFTHLILKPPVPSSDVFLGTMMFRAVSTMLRRHALGDILAPIIPYGRSSIPATHARRRDPGTAHSRRYGIRRSAGMDCRCRRA